MISLFVNGISVKVPKGSTVLQACEHAGFYVPRFCYHERLVIAGNCRICLVELEKSPKPVASCAIPSAPGIKVFSDSPLVRKARESVLEFLLINHPLDCPICDQGGECDLQDQSFFYGNERTRFFFKKRGVFDKNWGPLVKTVITRCIHCTRCVRFINELAGFSSLGVSGRGEAAEIGLFQSNKLSSFFSGNIVDLCPVGFVSFKKYY